MEKSQKNSNDLTVYFDGSCPLCAREIGFYQAKCTGNVAFIDIAANPLPEDGDLDQKSAMARFHVRLPDGRLQSGGAGFRALWSETPGFRLLARLCDNPPMRWIIDRAYDGFLKFRPATQKIARKFLK